jgi:hypothetical protein
MALRFVKKYVLRPGSQGVIRTTLPVGVSMIIVGTHIKFACLVTLDEFNG